MLTHTCINLHSLLCLLYYFSIYCTLIYINYAPAFPTPTGLQNLLFMVIQYTFYNLLLIDELNIHNLTFSDYKKSLKISPINKTNIFIMQSQTVFLTILSGSEI